MSFLFLFDNVNFINGACTVAVTNDLSNNPKFINCVSLFNPIAAKGSCLLADKSICVVLENNTGQNIFIRLSSKMKFIESFFFPNITKLKALIFFNDRLYIASTGGVYSIDTFFSGEWKKEYEAPDNISVTGIAFNTEKAMIITETDFLNYGAVKYVKSSIIFDDCSEPWSLLSVKDELIFVDGLRSELVIVGNEILKIPIKKGYLRKVVSTKNSWYVFYGIWRWYKKRSIFIGNWDRIPSWMNTEDINYFNSGIIIINKSNKQQTHIKTTHFCKEYSDALLIDNNLNLDLFQDSVSIFASCKEHSFLKNIAIFRKKIS